MSSFDLAIATVLLHEGGFVNDPHDAGGATKYGISLRWLQSLGDIDSDGYLDGDFDKNNVVNAVDIKNLNLKEATDLYKKQWWDKYGYEKIQDQALATKVFDLAINAGPKVAHRCLQRALRAVTGEKLIEDGVLGIKTLTAVNNVSSEVLLAAYRSEAAGFYRSLRNPLYEAGWLNRAYS
jgi:lysozyme family protein